MSKSNNSHPPVLLLHNVDSSCTPEDALDCQLHVERMAGGLRAQGHMVETAPVYREVADPLRAYDPREQVVFNWCEGIDGQPNAYDVVAHTLDQLGFTYTGSGPWTLRHTQNKAGFKRVLDELGIPTPRWRVFTRSQDADAWDVFPSIVKPVAEHCSYGITSDSVVNDAAKLRRQIDAIMAAFGVGALVEEYIEGREINVSIWGNGTPMTLPLYEIDFSSIADPSQQIVSYDSKWVPESFQYKSTPVRCPTDVDEALTDTIRRTALAAYRAMRCRDYGRIDTRVRDGVAYVVDVNANCDITIDGGFAKTAKVAGYDYGAMASQIVRWANTRMANS
jgi:D-alanine-D-alanine ligase